MMRKWYVYELKSGSLHGWYAWTVHPGEPPQRTEIGSFARAVNILAKWKPDTDWYGFSHEYWTMSLPGAGPVVVLRPESNPYAGGILVSPVRLPWLDNESEIEHP